MISVIIPTLNRSSTLSVALKSLVAQISEAQFEVIVVDNGSTDATKAVTEKFIIEYPSHQISYIYESVPGPLSARHRGALAAKGDIFVFIDDDIDADVYWLQAIADSFVDQHVQLVGGRNLPKYEAEPPEWLNWFWRTHPYGRTCEYLSLLDFGDEVREIDANYIWSLNFSIRKQALFDLGGFHPDYLPQHLQHFQGDGETGLTRKAKQLNYKAIYQPKATIFHQVSASRMSYEYFAKRFYFQGVCDSYHQIRKSGGLKKLSWRERVNQIKAQIKEQFWKIKQEFSFPDKLAQEHVLKRLLNQSLKNGYEFHQQTIRKNPDLLDWILKADYWDYKLPTIKIQK